MFKCEFPGCNYSTENRSQIHYHHIVPIENDGSNKKYNRIWLCPNHHTRVYIPESKRGIHSLKTNNSIILVKWIQSTGGRLLEYYDIGGKHKYI